MNAPLYTIEVLRLAGSLPDRVEFDRVDGSAHLRSPTCGSTVRTEVQMVGGVITAISQDVRACAFAQASAALVAQYAEGRSRDEIAAILAALSEWLSGERDNPGETEFMALAPARSRTSRHGAILLPLRALLAAMEDAEA
jgi:NifU-like protein involved in Fe-S cluster formation